MVADSRAKMNKLVMGISDIVVHECRSVLLIPRMEISHLMVHAKLIEKQKIKKICRELKKVRTKDGNSSETKFEVKHKPRLKSRFSNQGHYNAPKVNNSMVSTP